MGNGQWAIGNGKWAMAHGIDPYNPLKMIKRMFFAGTHQDHQKFMNDLDKKNQEKQPSAY